MNSKVYKWCAVPLCKNTSKATPNKVFVYVPNKKAVRDKWLRLAQRDPGCVVTSSPLYFCEDHFDLPNDMENYMQYHLMGSVSQVRMKPGCIPKNFACQADRIKRISGTTKLPNILRKRKMVAIEKCDKQLKQSSIVTVHFDSEEIASGSSVYDEYNCIIKLSPSQHPWLGFETVNFEKSLPVLLLHSIVLLVNNNCWQVTICEKVKDSA